MSGPNTNTNTKSWVDSWEKLSFLIHYIHSALMTLCGWFTVVSFITAIIEKYMAQEGFQSICNGLRCSTSSIGGGFHRDSWTHIEKLCGELQRWNASSHLIKHSDVLSIYFEHRLAFYNLEQSKNWNLQQDPCIRAYFLLWHRYCIKQHHASAAYLQTIKPKTLQPLHCNYISSNRRAIEFHRK